jgi:hypothetical protein
LPEYREPSDHGDKDIRKALVAIFASADPGEWYIIKGGHWAPFIVPADAVAPIPSLARRRIRPESRDGYRVKPGGIHVPTIIHVIGYLAESHSPERAGLDRPADLEYVDSCQHTLGGH